MSLEHDIQRIRAAQRTAHDTSLPTINREWGQVGVVWGVHNLRNALMHEGQSTGDPMKDAALLHGGVMYEDLLANLKTEIPRINAELRKHHGEPVLAAETRKTFKRGSIGGVYLSEVVTRLSMGVATGGSLSYNNNEVAFQTPTTQHASETNSNRKGIQVKDEDMPIPKLPFIYIPAPKMEGTLTEFSLQIGARSVLSAASENADISFRVLRLADALQLPIVGAVLALREKNGFKPEGITDNHREIGVRRRYQARQTS